MLRILILIILCVPSFLWSQAIENEDDLIKKADEHFEKGSFIEALPLYSQLVSLHPKDPTYNYKFGTCVIYSGVDKETAIKHLTFATKKNVKDPRAYYYLGLAKHQNYEFREAKKLYSDFLKKADDKVKAKFDVQRQIEMCSNGEGLLSNLTDLIVLDKKEVSQDDFFRYYELDEIGGKVIVKPEELLTKNDKKRGLKGVVHFIAGSEYLYFSSFGKDGDNLDLYRVKPLSGGEYSKPELLKGAVNSRFDEDFAFMHSDEQTFYFSSKGHSSMGGYDVFKCTYDRINDSYDQVENLDFAINTPDDDLFYLVDSTKTMAYFASSRSSSLNNLNVYKVRVETLPLNLVVLQGDFITEIELGSKNSKITVYDDFTGLRVGEFYTNPSSGKYTIPLERAGTYRFMVETEGSQIIHEGMVEIPVFVDPVALRQGLVLSNKGGSESLKINNYFEEPMEADMAALAQDILRRKASLDVNANEMTALLEAKKEEKLILENNRPISEAVSGAGFGEDVTIAQIASEMKSGSSDLKSQAEFLKSRAEEAYAEAQIIQKLAQEKLDQGKAVLSAADESDPAKYSEQTSKGNNILFESKNLSRKAQSLLEVVKSVDLYAEELNMEGEALEQNALEVEMGKDYKQVVSLLTAEKERQRNLDTDDVSDPNVTLTNAAEFKANELGNLIKRIEQYREDETNLVRKIGNKKKEIEAQSKKSKRETLEMELVALQNELTTTVEDLEDETKKVNAVSSEATNYALQRSVINRLNEPGINFEGEAEAYVIAQVEEQISQVKANASEAQSMIPESSDVMASASAELKRIMELKDVSKPASSLAETPSTQRTEELKLDYAANKTEILDSEDESLKSAKLAALNRTYEAKLKGELKSIDQNLKETDLTVEQKSNLASTRATLSSELNTIEESESGKVFTKQENALVMKEYAPNTSAEIDAWKSNSPNLGSLENVDALAESISEELNDVIISKSQQILESADKAEITELSQEIEALKQAKKEASNLVYSKDFLAEVYASQMNRNPEEGLEISEEYRTLLEQKIIHLDQSNEGLSESEKAENRQLKNQLSLELTTTTGRITQIESTNDLTNVENPEVNPSEEVSNDTASAADIELLESIMPRYSDRLSSAEQNQNGAKVQLEEKIQIEEELMSLLSDEINSKNNLISISEDESLKSNLQSELSTLQSLRETKRVEIEEMLVTLDKIEESESIAEAVIPGSAEIEAERANILDDSQLGEINNYKLSKAEVTDEIKLLPVGVKRAFVKNNSVAKAAEVTEVRSAEVYRDLIENNSELSAAQKNQSDILDLRDWVEELKAVDPENEEEESVVNKRLKKAEKKLAKMEAKISPQVLAVAGVNYDNKLAAVDQDLLAKSENLPADHPVFVQVQKLRAEAVVYNEDAAIYEELAEGNKKKSVAQADTYNEATAKKMAALENLKRAQWLLDNADDLTELSPETMERMMVDKSLTQPAQVSNVEVAGITPEVEIEETEQLSFTEELMLLDDDLASIADVQKEWVSTPEELETLKATETYVSFESKSEILNENFVTLVGTQSQINSSKVRAKIKEREAEELEASIENLASEEEKEVARAKVQKLRAAAKVQYNKSDKLEYDRVRIYEHTKLLKSDLVELEKGFDPEYTPSAEALAARDISSIVMPEDLAEVTEPNSDPTESSTDVDLEVTPEIVVDPINTIVEETVSTPVVITPEETTTAANAKSIYERSLDLSDEDESSLFTKTKDVYNEARPIPVGVSLPEGVVFKVQVGAFKNPIPQNLYNEFAPVMGEELNNGITRYTAGLFKQYNVANSAKSDIRSLGYSDAFVVAYKNGERISLNEARNFTGSSVTTDEPLVINTSAIQENVGNEANGNVADNTSTISEENSSNNQPVVENKVEENLVSSTQPENSEFNPTEASDDYYENFPEAAEANQIEVLKGLFYTVQVGVYSKPVPAKQIYNISPLNSERLNNSNVRYTTGIYNNLEEAVRRKEEIQSVGIADAFVTAYFNGNRITIAAANRKFQEGGMEVLEVTNQVTDTATAPDEKYVVYIGTFTDEVPANVAKAMLFLEDSRGIVQKQDGNQVAYFTKEVNSEQTAKLIKQEFESYEVYSVTIQKVGASQE